MRIALLSVFYPFRGGIAQFGASLFRALEEEHTVEAFTFTRQYPDLLFPGKSQFVSEGDKADTIPAVRCLDTINPLTYAASARQIIRSEPDLLITQFWMPFFAPSLGYIAGKLQKRKVPTVAILHNVIPHEQRPGDRQLINYYLNRHNRFIALTNAVRDELLEIRPQSPATVLPHPVYSHFGAIEDKSVARAKFGIPAGKKVLLFFGFIRHYKGLDLLLEAFAALPEEYHLVIAGEVYGPFDPYQRIIDQTGTADRITRHIQYISDEDVAGYFSAADLIVLPYRSATQSGIAQIAYNFDLPVLCTDVGGLSEMVQDGETGILLHEATPAAIAENIERFFRDKLSAKMTAKIHVGKTDYSWQAFSEKLVSFAELD